MNQTARLKWQCRRGMLELDLLLERFLDGPFAQLSTDQQAVFERLLRYPDHLLLEYLMGRMTPTDPGLADVVAKIRHPAAS